MHPEAAPLWWHIGQAKEDGGFIEGAVQAYTYALEANPWYQRPAQRIRSLEARTD